MRTIHSVSASAILFVSLAAGCGIESSVVGGRCREGFVLSGDTCVPVGPGTTLITPTDPPVDAPPPSPSGLRGIGDPNHRPGFIGPVVIDPTVIDPVQPIEPYLPPKDPPPLVCKAPLVECRGKCISVDSDAANCGACGKICPSNICIGGECQGATPGDVVLIGHDYTDAFAGSAQAKVLVNALTIPTTDPIRVLSYEDGASPSAVAQAKALAVAGISGRKIRFTIAPSASTLTSDTLGKDYDVVMIHDVAGDAAAIGTSWSTSLGVFTMKGGVVIALDRGTSPIPELLTSSNLLTVASHTLLPDATHLLVTDAADVVGAQVLSPYAGFGPPVCFQGIASPSTDLDWVVRWQKQDFVGTLGDPVVVHRTVR